MHSSICLPAFYAYTLLLPDFYPLIHRFIMSKITNNYQKITNMNDF